MPFNQIVRRKALERVDYHKIFKSVLLFFGGGGCDCYYETYLRTLHALIQTLYDKVANYEFMFLYSLKLIAHLRLTFH